MKKKMMLSIISSVFALSVLAACGDTNTDTDTTNDPATGIENNGLGNDNFVE